MQVKQIKERRTKHVTFVIADKTNEMLNQLYEDLNKDTTIKISKSQIVNMLIKNAKNRELDLARLMLNY